MSNPPTPFIDVDIVKQDIPDVVQEFFDLRNAELHEVVSSSSSPVQRSVSLDSGSEELRASRRRRSWSRAPSLATCAEEQPADSDPTPDRRYEARAESVPIGRVNGTPSNASFASKRPHAENLEVLIMPSREFLEQQSPQLRDDNSTSLFVGNLPCSAFRLTPTTPCSGIVRKLANMGDHMNQRELRGYLQQLTRQASVTYSQFSEAAEKIVPLTSAIRWRSVAAFLFFSHWLALQLGSTTESLYSLVMEWTIRYIGERFAAWIAEQGGWANCLGPMIPPELVENVSHPAVVGTVCLLVIAAIVSFVRWQRM